MYIFERLLSISIYLIVLFIICFGIRRSSNLAETKKYLFLYIVVLVIMACSYKPLSGSDLPRLISIMNYYSSLSVPNLINTVKSGSYPVLYFYYYIIGNLGMDYLLPGITALIVFSFLFISLYKAARYFNADSKDVAKALFWLMTTDIFIVSIAGIRNSISISIIIYCLCTEYLYNRKPIYNIGFYLLAASFHSVGQVIILYRIVLLLFEKGNGAFDKIQKIVLSGISLAIILLRGARFIENIISKGETYYLEGQSGEAFTYSWSYVIVLFGLYIIIRMIIETNRTIRLADLIDFGYRKFVKFLYPLMAAALLLVFVQYSMFTRVGGFVSVLAFVCVIIAFYSYNNSTGKKYIFQRNMEILMFLRFLLIFARGSMTSLNFFNIG